MSRLPTPGADDNTWGDILNDFLSVSHNADGTLKDTTLTKSDVGLGNVDNTSDANKPISSATQTALDTKQDADTELSALAGLTSATDKVPYFTGSGTASTASFTSFGRSVVAAADTTALLSVVPQKSTQLFSTTGTVGLSTGKSRFYVESNYTILSVRASVGTAPTGASLIVDVNKNGTTMYTTQGNRPTIAAASNTVSATLPDVTTLTAGDYITIDVDQVGSTVAGTDLTVSIGLQRTS